MNGVCYRYGYEYGYECGLACGREDTIYNRPYDDYHDLGDDWIDWTDPKERRWVRRGYVYGFEAGYRLTFGIHAAVLTSLHQRHAMQFMTTVTRTRFGQHPLFEPNLYRKIESYLSG